ncbi:hypothetical protein KCTC52924_00134 [Arenibacter antarcticus]|uniref:Heavy-metal-associated domain-containing protein n=1 Tax=Arenibacter antarcticus TaxID=2040469 RepID=A0ABW5VLI9_9FLAO|nr:heavy-metal-associated domain-containing protein [Arenibacter sp. H213]MCM4169100.1 hypothetical protein [Arenibacter sp. H213]
MSFVSENVIPGNHGKIFGTDAKEKKDLDMIKQQLMKIEGIKEVLFNDGFPKEFRVHTSKVVQISDIERKVSALGFHAVRKSFFSL